MRSWGWDHHGRPGGRQGGRHRLRTLPRHGAPVRLVCLHGGHEDREEEEDRGGRSQYKYDTFGTKKKLIRTEHPCKIKNPIQYLSNKMDVSNLDIQYIDDDEASEDLSVVERELNEDYQPKSVKSG